MKQIISSFMAIICLATSTQAQSWLLAGNSGTTASNFVGTTDIQALRFRVKNIPSGVIDSSTRNTALGYMSLRLTTGSDNTAFGCKSLQANTGGFSNTANGVGALYSNSNGFSNTACGINSLFSNTTGFNNTANGSYALLSNNTGSWNTATGYAALHANTSGKYNVANGSLALYSNTTGNSNVALGAYSLYKNTNRSNLVAIGDSALYNNGIGAVNSLDAAGNTAVGSKALYSNTTGNFNSANGNTALYYNLTGSSNTANGAGVLYNNVTGNNNTANGTSALFYNSSGSENVATGNWSLIYNYAGSGNTANGSYALQSNQSGNYNTAIGFEADVLSSNFSNATAVGFQSLATASNTVRIGNGSIISIGGQVGWTNFSDGRIKKNIKENVPGLQFISLLRPVTYNYDLNREYVLTGRTDSASYAEKYAIEKINFSGFVAQEVDAAAKKIGYEFSGIDNAGKIMGLRYSEFVVPLVKAVQELSAINEELTHKNEMLKTEISNTKADLQKQVDELKDALLRLAAQKDCLSLVNK